MKTRGTECNTKTNHTSDNKIKCNKLKRKTDTHIHIHFIAMQFPMKNRKKSFLNMSHHKMHPN